MIYNFLASIGLLLSSLPALAIHLVELTVLNHLSLPNKLFFFGCPSGFSSFFSFLLLDIENLEEENFEEEEGVGEEGRFGCNIELF